MYIQIYPHLFQTKTNCYWSSLYLACSTGTSCSSGKVAGLIFFEAFCYLWTSQVVGNVALATLAGGPYGGILLFLTHLTIDNLFTLY